MMTRSHKPPKDVAKSHWMFVEPVPCRTDLAYWEDRLCRLGVPYEARLVPHDRWGAQQWTLLVNPKLWELAYS